MKRKLNSLFCALIPTERRFELSQKAAARGLDDTHNRTIQASIAQQAQTTGLAEAFARAKAKGDDKKSE